MILSFDPNELLDLPDPQQDGIVTLADVSASLSKSSRSRSRTKAQDVTLATPMIEIAPLDDDPRSWAVRSENLATALGCEAGPQAETAVMHHLAESAPHLLKEVDFDSYDGEFVAYASDRDAAEELRLILMQMQRP